MRLGLVSLIVFGVVLCSLNSYSANAIVEKNYTFSDLGLKATTFSGPSDKGTNTTFNSSIIKDLDNVLYLHLLVISPGIVTAKINNVSLFTEYFSKQGEYAKRVKIPTGLIRKGSNTIGIICKWNPADNNYNEITLLEDSAIGTRAGWNDP